MKPEIQQYRAEVEAKVLVLMGDTRERTSSDIYTTLRLPQQTVGHCMTRLRKRGLVDVDFVQGVKIWRRV